MLRYGVRGKNTKAEIIAVSAQSLRLATTGNWKKKLKSGHNLTRQARQLHSNLHEQHKTINMKSFSFAILLFLFWISLSGHLEPLLLGLGAASVALTVFLSHRMNLIDHESYPLHLSLKMPGFFLYLFREIVKANIDVVTRILSGRKALISPQMIDIPQSQKSDLGAVIYANSITLTPGTVTIKLSENHLTVHALSREAASELADGAMSEEITRRVFKE
ncbi:MAG TPA: Na+/H+ antiporter subunit E [Gammaproteobacteria bacterium]